MNEPLLDSATTNDTELSTDLEERIQSEVEAHQAPPVDPSKVTMSNLFENSISFHSSPLTSSDIDDEILAERSLLSSLIDYRDANLTPRASGSAASDSSNDDVRPHNRESPGNPLTAAQRQQPGKWLFSGHSHTDNSSDDIDTIIVIPDNTRHDKKTSAEHEWTTINRVQ